MDFEPTVIIAGFSGLAATVAFLYKQGCERENRMLERLDKHQEKTEADLEECRKDRSNIWQKFHNLVEQLNARFHTNFSTSEPVTKDQ